MSVLVKRGAPRPYRLATRAGEDNQYTRHAIFNCVDCNAEAAVPWVKQENPTFICRAVERAGWVVYHQKAHCPNCSLKRKQATPERELEMQNTHTTPAKTTNGAAVVKEQQVFLVIIDAEGNATMRSLKGMREMLFADETYIVIPAGELNR